MAGSSWWATTDPELSGSAWAAARGHRGRGTLPQVDLDAVGRVAEVLRSLVNSDMVAGVHDVASGGVGVALAEMAVRSGIGVTVARIPDHAHLFSESSGRALVCVSAERTKVVLDVLELAGVPHSRIGVAGGDRFSVKGLVDLPLASVRGRMARPAAPGARRRHHPGLGRRHHRTVRPQPDRSAAPGQPAHRVAGLVLRPFGR